MKLPPLPIEFVYGGLSVGAHWMQVYGLACARAALEAAAEMCDKYSTANAESDLMCSAFDHCAEAIKKLEIES